MFPNCRWKEEFEQSVKVTPWRPPGKHFLLIGQFRRDHSLYSIVKRFGPNRMTKRFGGVERHYQWIVDQVCQ